MTTKKNGIRLSALAAALAFAGIAQAQVTQSGACDPLATTCSSSNQHVGNVDPSASATNSTSGAAQAGNSANNNGATFSPVNTASPQQQQSIGNTSFANQGGNTSSTATGGAATGNLSNNDNHSSVGNTSATTGASTSNSGGNTLSNGANTNGANLGSNSNDNGSNTATTGNNRNTNTSLSAGGSGGAGGAGGAGGSATGGTSRSTSSAAGGTVAGSGNSRQGQGQGQSQQQANLSRNALVGGNTASSNTNGQNVGNGQSTTIGGSSYSDNSKTIFIPPVVPPTPPSVAGVGNVVQTVTACGAPKQVVKTPIEGVYFGMFSNEHIQQGYTYDLAPVLDTAGMPMPYKEVLLPNGDIKLMGTQAVILSTVVSIAGARNVAIGGGGGSGSWGQAGGGASASMTQLATNIQLMDCDMGTLRMAADPVVAPVVLPPPLPTRKVVYHPPVVHHVRRVAPCK